MTEAVVVEVVACVDVMTACVVVAVTVAVAVVVEVEVVEVVPFNSIQKLVQLLA